MNDLALIPQRGFDALNVGASTRQNNAICAEGFGNPLLVQEICSEFCIKNGIFGWSADTQKLNMESLEIALNEIAKSKGFPKYSKLKAGPRSEEHTSELQSLMRISYAVFCLKKKNKEQINNKER